MLTSAINLTFLSSCTNDNVSTNIPSAADFATLKTEALASETQTFQITGGSGAANLVSAAGVMLYFDANSFTLNGNPVTGGIIDIKYIEIFDGGTMAVTGIHTMGLMPNNQRAMLLSGGAFYINATQNGQQLEMNSPVGLLIPTLLTDENGQGNPNMTLWNFIDGNVWVQENDLTGQNGVFIEGTGQAGATSYFAYLNNFGWTNVDCFYNDPRAKTTILASIPEGYTNANASVYLHYDGQGNALALLDTYDETTGLFSEHYGQIPIGLQCHIIFVSEANGQWRYAIKSATISAGAIYYFTLSETNVGSKEQLVDAINALP
jgi:hypothetical protein